MGVVPHLVRLALVAALVCFASPPADAAPSRKKSSQVEKKKKKKKSKSKKARADRRRSKRDDRTRAPRDEVALAEPSIFDAPTPDVFEDMFPGLASWVHPIIATEDKLSRFPGREFGAKRTGVPRARSRGCGGGHCGMDLHAERGRPIVAVAAGILVKVQKTRAGISGRYVRVRHDDGTFTTYMHLDTVMDSLEVGDEVSAGQQLGTLGSTGVSSGIAHLHFALQIPIKPDNGKGDHKPMHTRWIDPAPFLEKAEVLDTADRSPSRPPSS